MEENNLRKQKTQSNTLFTVHTRPPLSAISEESRMRTEFKNDSLVKKIILSNIMIQNQENRNFSGSKRMFEIPIFLIL
jgi:transglutaminase/protease-like cytokinesis protein 3